MILHLGINNKFVRPTEKETLVGDYYQLETERTLENIRKGIISKRS
jgi:hypothetical protein